MADPSLTGRQDRWRDEASFFDQSIADAALAPIDPLTLRRYQGPLHRRFNKEYRLRLLGDLRGRQVLDVGCGDGVNSVLLATLGASVTGVDISQKSIEAARKRAELNQVAGTCRFLCGPLETTELAADSFDVIWGDAILHHVIPELPLVFERLKHWAKPGALMIFSEPVNFNPTLRRIRFMVPVTTDVTPGERPLEPAEIAIMRRYIPDLSLRHFALLGRLDRFILVNYNYEKSWWPRRAISNGCAVVDSFALAMPGVRRLAGGAVLFGHPFKS